MRHALDEILPYDDLLIRESRGNIRLDVEGEPRRLAFDVKLMCPDDASVDALGQQVIQDEMQRRLEEDLVRYHDVLKHLIYQR